MKKAGDKIAGDHSWREYRPESDTEGGQHECERKIVKRAKKEIKNRRNRQSVKTDTHLFTADHSSPLWPRLPSLLFFYSVTFWISLFMSFPHFVKTLTLSSSSPACAAIRLAVLFLLSSAYMVISHLVSNLPRKINLFFLLHQELLQWSSTLALKVAQKMRR